MLQFWLVVTLSWIDFASLQYINTGGPKENSFLDPLDPTLQYSLPYSSYFNLAPTDSQASSVDNNQFYNREDGEQNLHRKRSPSDSQQKESESWYPNLVDSDKTAYMENQEQTPGAPFVIQRFEGYSGTVDGNATDMNGLEQINKRSFSPWGGKRSDRPKYEQSNMWTWKRTASIREPSMPKRVRFSPWGGKRSGQLIYKPGGGKSSKLIFSNTIPELTRIISNYAPNGAHFNLAGFQLIPTADKRTPIRILALSTRLEEKLRESLPIHAYVEAAKIFKPGHPYADLNLKKDGKRKVKFSAWGGKRSPPIIGPIWTPPSENGKDNTLDAILLVRNGQPNNIQMAKAL